MSDRIKKIKIKQSDGTFSDYIPIGADAKNIDTTRGESVQSVVDKTARYYNTVEAMKLDDNIQIGDTCITLGYYEKDDGGGATYKIVDDSTLEEDGGSVHKLNNELKAKLLINNSNYINVKQFGVKGDGVTNETDLINKILNISEIKKLIFNENESYILNDFVISSNKTIDLNNSTIIINTPEGKCKVQNVENVTIKNGHIKSNTNRDDYSQDPNLSLVYVASSKNIQLYNLIIDYAITDGIVLARPYGQNHNENIYIKNCIVKSAGRNGFAITDGKNVYVNDCEFSNAQKWLPRFAIDLEPNFIDDKLENININNINTHDNGFGSISIAPLRTAQTISIFINNIISFNDNISGHFNILLSNDHTAEQTNVTHNEGIIIINNYQAFNCNGFPLGIYGNKYDEIKFIIDNCNMECKSEQIRWHGTTNENDILGNASFKLNLNKQTGFQYNCNNHNNGYKNIFIKNERFSIPIASEIGDASTFDNVLFATPYSYTAANIATLIYNGTNDTVINKYGTINVTKSSTGQYKIENLGRGAWIVSQSGYNVGLYTNGVVTVKNNEGAYVDDTLFILKTTPTFVGQIEAYI